jgi:hypothetical protein
MSTLYYKKELHLYPTSLQPQCGSAQERRVVMAIKHENENQILNLLKPALGLQAAR